MRRGLLLIALLFIAACEAKTAPPPPKAKAPPVPAVKAPAPEAAPATKVKPPGRLGSGIARSAKREPREKTVAEESKAMIDKQARRLAERAAKALRDQGQTVEEPQLEAMAESLRDRARKEIYVLLRLKLLGAKAGLSNTVVAVAIGSLDEAFEITKIDPESLTDVDLKAHLDRAVEAVKIARKEAADKP